MGHKKVCPVIHFHDTIFLDSGDPKTITLNIKIEKFYDDYIWSIHYTILCEEVKLKSQ